MFCYPLLGLLSGVMPHLQLLALVIPYSGNTPVRCDPGFSLDTFYINKCNVCYPFLPLSGVLSGVKVILRLLPLVIPYSGTLRYDMTLVLALLFLHKYMSILLPHFITSFGVAVRGKAKLRILELVSPYSEKPTVRHVSDLTLVLLHKRITICYPLFTHFGVAVRGKAKLEMLAFVISYSENTIR